MALNITPPVGHLAANFPGLPQQIGLLGAGDIPTTGLLSPFTPMNLPDYTGDLPTSAYDVTSYVEKYYEDQKRRSGGGNGNGGTEGWGERETGSITGHETLYPGHQAAAAAAGVGGPGSFWGEGKIKNEAWRDAMRVKMDLEPGEKFYSGHYRTLVNNALTAADEDVETTNTKIIAAAVNDYIGW